MLAIVLVILIAFLTYSYVQNKSNNLEEESINFFKEYSIALNNIHVASNLFNTASINLDVGTYYAQAKDYSYEYAISYFDLGKKQSLDARELLIKTKMKLQNMRGTVQNSFVKDDILNRIKQAESLVSVNDDLYLLIDYQGKQLYEVNYGSESMAVEYKNKYDELIPSYNDKLKNLTEIQNKIDLYWDQDWYPEFEATSAD